MSITDAAATAQVDATMPYHRRDADEAFRKAWNKAGSLGKKMLEMESGRRAFHGTLKPVFYMGEEVGQIREYSDALMMFLLRAKDPTKYRDNASLEVKGKLAGDFKLSDSDKDGILLAMAEKLTALQEANEDTHEDPSGADEAVAGDS